MNETADCEGRDDWFWQQDVNAWTSLAFLIPAVVAVRWAWRRGAGRAFALVGALAAAEAVGSVMFHGSGGDVAQAMHDLPLVGLVGFIAGWQVGRSGIGHPGTAATIGAVVGVGAGALAWWAAPAAVNVLVGVGIVVAAGAEVRARRAGLPAMWTVGLLVALAVAVVTWALGRSDSPWCDPASLAQWHGLWHTTSALVIAAWIHRAAAITVGDPDLRIARPLIDRGLGLVAIALVRAFHRSIDVVGRAPAPGQRPTLVVANHANGFVDPLLLTAVLGRLPRLLGKAALWKVVAARPVLALAGVLPVYRSADGDRPSNNARTFAEVDHELARRGTAAIFPEGTTGDRGGLDRIRKGAARIALDAVDHVPDLRIVPVGMAYESRTETRSRALVMFGDDIEVAEWMDAHADAGPEALTETIRERLAAISPGYDSRDDREWMRAASRASLADRGRQPTFGQIEVRARRLADLPAPARDELWRTYAEFAARLSVLGVDADDLAAARPSFARLVLTALLVLLVTPIVAFGVTVHLPVIALVLLATTSVRATATKGTVRMIVGAVGGLITWIVAGILLGDGWGVLGFAAITAAAGALALAALSPWWRAARGIWSAWQVRDRRALLDPVLEVRHRLARMVEDAVP